MAKFYGKIGYSFMVETSPGVWQEDIKELPYFGDVTKVSRRWDSTSQANDDLNISNEISIVADPFANENFYAMKYVSIYGAKWKITNVSVQYPRLVLSVGGLYTDV